MIEGWITDILSNLCNVEYGTRVVRKRDAGSIYPVYGGGGATFSMDTFNREDRMVVGRFAMSEKCTRFVKGKFFLNDSGLTLSTKKHVLMNDEFLNYQLLSLNDTIYSIGRGTAQKNLNVNEFKKLYLSFPNSIQEQKEIVSILDDAFASIDKAKVNIERNIENAKELFQSKLNEIFSQTGEGWEEKNLGEVCDLYQGLAINKKTKHLLVEKSSLPLLRIKDLRNNTEEKYVSETGYPVNSLVNENEIIYTRTGNSLGLVFRGRKGILHNNSFKIIPQKILSNNYLFWWLQHEDFTCKIISLASKAAQPDITHKLFKQQKISIPPLEIQDQYFEVIELFNKSINDLLSSYEIKMNDLDELKKSILQKAFSGELTNKSVAA